MAGLAIERGNDMNAEQLAKPDNAADKTITLAISGNRLVSILNALDAAMHELGRYRFEGDKVVVSSEWYATVRETTEAMRDELSRQRNSKTYQVWSTTTPLELIESDTGFHARNVYAVRHGLVVTDCAARPLELGTVER